MIRSELVVRVAEMNPHLYEKDCKAVVRAILNCISNALARDDRVELRDFGAFTVVTHRPHTGRNPRTGALVDVDEEAAVRFKPGKGMRDRLKTGGVAAQAPTHAAARL